MYIKKANLSNLTSLWEKYGAREIKGSTLPTLYASTHWPHRCWLDWESLAVDEIDSSLAGDAWLDKVPETMILPVWSMIGADANRNSARLKEQIIDRQLEEKKWLCAFQQTAMYLPLQLQEGASYLPLPCSGFQVNRVRSGEEIVKWIEIASEAFAYSIDRVVIEKLTNDNTIQILTASQNEQVIACALLYKTGNSIGVHQLGVKKAFQGKGVARRFMLEIIAICALWQGKVIVLQASKEGRPLYESLGFKAQFLIKNYKKI